MPPIHRSESAGAGAGKTLHPHTEGPMVFGCASHRDGCNG